MAIRVIAVPSSVRFDPPPRPYLEDTPSERAHQALEVLLAIVGDAEPRVRGAEHGANVPVSPH
jgi:hypothetical protein